MVVYNFRSLKAVPTGPELLDIVLSRTQRKTATQVHKRFAISRIRSFYMMKIKFTQQTFHDRISQIVDEFPRLESIHPFYADLINVLYDRDHYKLALGQLNTARSLIDNIAKDYVRLLKFGDSLYRCKLLKRAGLGRMATVTKKLKASLAYLEQVRQHLARLPSIDPSTRTLMLTGYPNVGKSSFINKITRADVDVQPYAFTTKSLFVGHMDYKYLRWQVIDTPGILDHPLEQRNTIEMQAVTALAHLNCAVLFVIDVSGQSEYSIEKQVSLFHNIRPLFANKPLIVVANKTDVRKLADLEESESAELKKISDLGITIVEMSNITEQGIVDVRTRACDALLEARVAHKLNANKVDSVRHRIHVAMPKKRDDRERSTSIPASVLAARQAAAAAPVRPPSNDVTPFELTMTSMQQEGAEQRVLLRQVEARSGGAGVFNVDMRMHWELKDDEWKGDIIPEIFNGKNVADFFDKDIEARLDALEQEEEEIEQREMEQGEDSESELDEETVELARKINKKKKMLKLAAKMNWSNNAQPVPRPKRAPKLAKEFQEHLEKLGIKTDIDASNTKSKKRKRQQTDDDMQVDDATDAIEGTVSRVHPPSSSRQSHPPQVSVGKLTSIRDASKRAAAKRMKFVGQRAMNQLGRAGTADRHIADTKPKHLFSGKRGIGKTDRR